ncbi:major facilitator superfamily domain-containing protein [Cristinia sonorae]|uniref:Major facilitator superfamily domain-containing protein n=1 Tax=Cristinia sonorae TaxID=1940300 RepID=A0A8K0UVS5_9AGAR|nr:major facilitator superfamily domain-containing protein [Cristinia sonorae]
MDSNAPAAMEKRQQHDTEAEQNKEVAHDAPPRSMSLLKSILLTTCCTLSMCAISMTNGAVSISLPAAGRDLDIPEDQLQWLLSSYALSSGCLLILFGRLADLYGRRNIFVLGCLIHGAFSLGSGFANDLITISVLRGIQGVGAAATVPACLGILAHAFPPGHARSIAFATFSAGQPFGGAVGFLLGGALTEEVATSWRTMYWLIAGISALCIVLAYLYVERDGPSTETDRRVDWIGAALVTSGLVLIVFVFSDGEIAPQQWRTPYIIALLVVGVALIALFLLWQWHLERPEVRESFSMWAPPPLMKLSLWKRGRGKFAAIQAVVFTLFAGFQCWLLWIVLYYQNYQGYNPVQTMIRMIPMCPSGVICNVIIALIVTRVDGVFIITFGCCCTAAAGLLLALIDTSAPYWAYGFPSSVIVVVGTDFVFAGGTLFVAKLALPHEQSLAGGLYQTMSMLGQAFGMSISTIAFDRVRTSESSKLGVTIDKLGLNAPREAQLKAYRATSWTVVGFALFAAVLSAIFLRGVGVLSSKHANEHTEETTREKSGRESGTDTIQTAA